MIKAIKLPIRFNFELNKFITSMASFAQKVKGFDKLKACKLLYYADKFHLLKHGKPILGDIYHHLDYGPVPAKSLCIMNEVICEDKTPRNGLSTKDEFKKFLKIKEGVRKYPIFEIIKKPNLDCISASEQEALNETIKRYGNLTGGQLIDETHKDASWQKTEMCGEIDYRLFFEDEEDIQPGALEYLESLRENSEFLFGLSSND